MVFRSKETEMALEKALQNKDVLTDDEIDQIKDFLAMSHALGRVGQFLIWLIITFGALAAAFHQLRMEI